MSDEDFDISDILQDTDDVVSTPVPVSAPVSAPTPAILPTVLVESVDDLPREADVPDIKSVENETVSSTGVRRRLRGGSWTQRRAYKLFLGLVEWFRADPQHVYIIQYLMEKGVSKWLVLDLIKRFPICKTVYDMAKTFQEFRLVDAASHQRLHPGFVRFFMNCNYMSEYTPVKATNATVQANVTMAPVTVTFEEVTTNGTHKDKP